jgi:hypothetical protein
MVLLLSHQQRRPRIILELMHHQVFFCKTELLQRAIRATFFDRSLVYKKTKSSEEKRVIGCTTGGRTCIVFMGSHEVMKSLQKRVGSRLLIDDVSAKKREHSRKFEWRELAR